MSRQVRFVAIILALIAIVACDPNERRPGLWLTGETAPFAADWSFTNTIPEIAIQVHTPYLLPHSVTIWCSSVDGKLYVGSSAPETKRWPAWADADPNVKLKIDGKVYEVRLEPLTSPDEVAPVQQAFAVKYKLNQAAPAAAPRTAKLWAVKPSAT
jgi:hypothetical protein